MLDLEDTIYDNCNADDDDHTGAYTNQVRLDSYNGADDNGFANSGLSYELPGFDSISGTGITLISLIIQCPNISNKRRQLLKF